MILELHKSKQKKMKYFAQKSVSSPGMTKIESQV